MQRHDDDLRMAKRDFVFANLMGSDHKWTGGERMEGMVFIGKKQGLGSAGLLYGCSKNGRGRHGGQLKTFLTVIFYCEMVL